MITDELAKVINKDYAESDRVKKFYGSAIAAEASEENVYLDENLKVSYKEKDIAQVIETNLEMIITDIRINTNTLSKNERLPLILVGGVANTPLIAEKMKMMLENQILDRNVDLIGAEDTTYYCAIGGLLKFLTENV
jgi:cell division ATPase FtsA